MSGVEPRHGIGILSVIDFTVFAFFHYANLSTVFHLRCLVSFHVHDTQFNHSSMEHGDPYPVSFLGLGSSHYIDKQGMATHHGVEQLSRAVDAHASTGRASRRMAGLYL